MIRIEFQINQWKHQWITFTKIEKFLKSQFTHLTKTILIYSSMQFQINIMAWIDSRYSNKHRDNLIIGGDEWKYEFWQINENINLSLLQKLRHCLKASLYVWQKQSYFAVGCNLNLLFWYEATLYIIVKHVENL